MSADVKFLTDRQRAINLIDDMKDGDFAIIVVHKAEEHVSMRSVGEPCETMLLGLLEEGKALVLFGEDEDEKPHA